MEIFSDVLNKFLSSCLKISSTSWFPCLKHFNHCYNSLQTPEHKTLSHNLLNHVDHLISNHQNFMDAMIHKDGFSSKRKCLPDELEMNRLGTVTKHITIITKYSTKEAILQCDNYPELSGSIHVSWELREELSVVRWQGYKLHMAQMRGLRRKKPQSLYNSLYCWTSVIFPLDKNIQGLWNSEWGAGILYTS